MSATPTRGPRAARGAVLKLAQTIAERYVLDAPLDSGAQSEVWAADDGQTGARVVLKFFPQVVSGEEAERIVAAFETDRTALERLSSRYVLRPLGQGIHCRRPFLITEWVDGVDVATWACALGASPRDWARLRDVFQRLCEGLQAAHRVGITHGDVAPRNVLVRRGAETPVVLDFGMGSLAPGATRSARLHDDHSAPELLHAPVAPTLDTFALAVIFLELHAGASRSADGVAWRDVTSAGEAALRDALGRVLPTGSPFLDALAAALHHDPARRPQDAYALFASLERAHGDTRLGRAVWPESDELRGRIKALTGEVEALQDQIDELEALIARFETEYVYRVGQLIARFWAWARRNEHASRGAPMPPDADDPEAPAKARDVVRSEVNWGRRKKEAAVLLHPDRYPESNDDEREALTSFLSRANAAIDAALRGGGEAEAEAAWQAVMRDHARWRDTRQTPGETAGEEIARLRRVERDLAHQRVELEREVVRVRASEEYRKALAWQDDEARGVDHFAAEVKLWELRLAGQRNTWTSYVRSGLVS